MSSAAHPKTRTQRRHSRRHAASDSDQRHNHEEIFNPDFSVLRDGYQVRFANGIDHLCNKANLLIERTYASRGLDARHAAVDADRPGQATLVACRGELPFGTLTVGIDSDQGLLADALYRPQLDAERRKGARFCELTRLAIEPSPGSLQVMASLFHLAFMVARFVHDTTDMVIEVHPRHSGFYRRMLGHHIAGPERTCPRVNAPAVLMRLPLEHAERQIQGHGGSRRASRHSLYPLFFSFAEQEELLHKLRSAQKET